jgi:hypothetical protein
MELNPQKRVHWGPELYRVEVLGDGSCFFHSLLLSTNPTYHTLDLQTKQTWCQTLRNDIASALTVHDFLDASSNGTPLYKDLPYSIAPYRSNTYTLTQPELQKFTTELEAIRDQLPPDSHSFLVNFLAFREYLKNSQQSVGDEVHLLASRVLNIDIYLCTDSATNDPGYMLHDPRLAYKNRQSVILFNSGGCHWEPIVQQVGGQILTVFNPDHQLIRQLRTHSEQCWMHLQPPTQV